MARVGQFVMDPKAGGYCHVTLDSGEKLLVNHDQGGFKGGSVTISLVKLWGFSSETLYQCNLEGAEGKTILAELTRNAPPGGAAATPLGAFVNYVKECKSVDDVRVKCAALAAAQRATARGDVENRIKELKDASS